jgi:hypothetical protein
VKRCVGVEVGGYEETRLDVRRVVHTNPVYWKQQLGHELSPISELAKRSEPELA